MGLYLFIQILTKYFQGGLGVDGRIMFEYVLKEWDVRVRIRFICLSIRSSGDPDEQLAKRDCVP
jgi:hypothetical protein